MEKTQCPSCGEKTFSLGQKLRASGIFPEECQNCGVKGYLPSRWFGLTAIIIAGTSFFAGAAEDDTQKNIIFVAGSILALGSLIIYRWAPIRVK